MSLQSLISEKNIKTVGVFFGGQSSEHDISIITGEFALSELKKNGVEARGVYISKDGNFYLDEKISELQFFKGDYSAELKKMDQFSLDLSASKDRLVFEKKSFLGIGNKRIEIDFVFPCFHGAGGEDGTFQGLLEFFGVPYAGCGIAASSTAIDKGLTKNLFKAENINTTSYVTIKEADFLTYFDEIEKNISTNLIYPLFVKPTKAGSSIGISKVKNPENLKEALELAFFYDNEVIVENGVDNVRDLTCAVLSDGEKILASEVQESIFENGFLNYEDKYLSDGGTQLGESSSIIAPAKISEEEKQEIQQLSVQIFKSLGGNGTARIDFLMDKEIGKIYANEINTLPGTLYHHLWEKTDIEFSEVLRSMIQDGILRKASNKTQNAHFESNVLTEANSLKLQYSA